MSKSSPKLTLRIRIVLALAVGLFAVVLLTQSFLATRVRAAGFSAGNLVVYRVGDGIGSLSGNAAPAFLDEYTPSGTLVQSIALPTSVSGANRRLTSTGTSTNDGMLTRSADGQYLVLTGYDAAVGTAGVAGTTSSTVQRVIGRVDSAGNIDTSTVFNGTAGNSFSTVNIRAAASDGGTNFWAIGSNTAGVQYITLGATSSNQVSNTVTNLRAVYVFNGQLYISTASGSAVRVGTVGTGTPTTSGQTMTNLPGFPTAGNPNEFFFADLNAGVPGLDTLYVADDGGTIQKYSLVSGSWTANGSVSAASVRGLTASVSGTTVTLYGTTGASGSTGGGTIYKFTDSTGYNVSISGTATSLVTLPGGSNKAFRGIAFTPSSGPPNQPIAPTCPGSLSTTQGVPTSANVSATDPDGTVTSANIISTPVTGITLSNITPAGGVGGTLTATLNVANTTAAGTYNVTIRYSNNDPTPQTADCTVVVNVAPPNQPIVPNCPASLNVNQGSAGSANVSATDSDGTVTSASIISASVPGITLSNFIPAGGTGGTASATLNVASTTAIGSYNVTIRYSNNDATPQTADCTVLVNVNVAPDSVIISQIYGGGGNTGATLKNDYIELINHGSVPVNVNGWSVQAWSFATNSWQVTPLTNFTLQPGQYYLVQESQGAGGTDNLPTPDAIGTIAISSGSTKVALVSNTTPISTACPSGYVDLVGYGTDPVIGTCYEGSGAAPQLSNTTAIQRRYEGCFDTDDNAADFVTIAPTPHNTASATHDCTGLSAFGSANPSTVLQGNSTTLTVRVAPGQNPASTGLTVTADLTSIGGSANQFFSGSGTTFTYVATVPANNPSGMKSLPVTVTDGESRTAGTTILVSVLSTTPEHVTISQVYGGGGNTGATYQNDYVELYNPTSSPISMAGWSLQYGSATGTTFTGKTVLGGTIDPSHYYLVSLASGGATGAPLPTASVTGDINMAAAAGKIVLVSNVDTLIGACPVGTDTDIVDFVGYGTTANCHEGSANAPAPSNTTAIFRKNNGATDTDQNGNDFVTGAPNPRSTTGVVEFGPSVTGTEPATNATIAPYDSTITVDFSEPVDAVGVWYNVTCTSTGLHNVGTVAHSNDFKTWAFTPNVTFQFSEQCTATVYKDQIHDQDTDDSTAGTDTLAADYVWSFTVVGPGQAAPYPPSVHLTMGNPSNAVADVSQPLNYLMMKPTYAVSYNRDKGTPNWVSWHLDSSWYGTLARVDTFRADPAVDPSWYRVQSFDYAGSGFDRGHMTPNADRDNQNRIPINQETYLMSNMLPQSPDNNQGPWAALEGYLRTQTDAGNEIYIVSGPSGVGGVGSASGNTVTTIANGHVTVPSATWKVALILPQATGDDIARVTCSSRTIAVLMPNVQGIRNNDWHNYLTTIDAVEQLTGYDFYSNLPPAVQACIEAGTDGTNPPGTANQTASTTEDNAVTVTLQALQSNNNSLTFTIMSSPASGSLGSVSAATCSSGTCTATVTYTPAADFNGSDSFTFRANDGSVHSNTSTVTIGVSEVNDSPVASDDSKSTPEDTPLSFPSADLTANDSAGPANESTQVLTVTSVTGGANTHGSVGLASGAITYTPDANYHGPASFTYTVCDDGTTNGSPDSKCAGATVNLTIDSVNDDPVAVDDSANTNEDTPVTIDVRTNDSDVDGDSLVITAVTQGAHGLVTNNGNNVTYSPAANFNGTDSFSYTVSDGHGGTATASVNVTINAVNDNPVAVDDSATTNEDTPVNVNVRSNDSDVDGDSLTVSAVTQGAHGSVVNNGTDVTYSPAANFNGSDSFSYTVSDGHGGTATANVSITINAVNDAPVAVDDSATTDEDTPAPINVLGNDSDVDNDSLTVSAVTQGAHGSVANNGNNVTYSPAANFHGSDSFSYTISDGHGGTATANVSVTINSVNDAPVAVDDSATTNEDTAVTINVLGNDSDVDNDSLTVSAVTQGAHGSVTDNGADVTYSPAANFNGTDSFSYTISDGHGGTATANVSVTINSVNDAPVAVDDSASTNEDTAVTVNVLGNDSDVDNDPLTVSAVTQGAHGSVTNNGSNVTYSPAADYNGSDSFSYTVSDGHGGTATANVSVNVNSVNDNPVAVADSTSTNEDNSVTIDVVANDTDVDGDSLSLASVGSAAHGSVSIVSGKAVYAPAANYNGSDSFGYVVSDGHGGQANGVVSVTVNPVNDAPTANGQSVSTNSNTPVAITLTGSDVETPPGSLIFTVTSGPSHGSLSGSGANRLYTPNLNYSGPDSFKFTVTDTGDGASPALTSSEATVSIAVDDTVGPVITLNGNTISLWPANHSYQTVNVADLVSGASDNFDQGVNLNSVVIAQVTSDEVENGNGDGNTLNDIVISSDCKSVQLRAERDGSADGRVYTITFLARDSAGNTSTVTAKVIVPKTDGGGAIDSGPHYTVTSNCH